MVQIDGLYQLKEGYQMWHNSRADSVEYWLLLLDDNVKWRSIANGAAGAEFSKDCNCKAEVVDYFRKLVTNWEMIFYKVREFIADGDRVVALSHCAWKNRHTGKTVETEKADVFRLRYGKIVEFFEYYDSAALIAAAQAD